MTVRIVVVDDYSLVVAGVARLLEPFADRIEVVEITANRHPREPVDVGLHDAFAQGQADHDDLTPLLEDESIGTVIVYTWNFSPELIETARRRGVGGYVSKAASGAELADAIEEVAAGRFVVSPPPPSRGRPESRGDWPGRSHGLTERESEVLALITQGHGTRRIAETMHLSQNTIKTYSRSLYRRLGVHDRSAAILWGIDHGFRPDRKREQHPNR
ncbi:response regulator transcription factor [Ilumatobacter sp.]|uniref:response regulator transcription factor n=1 Tax=Ilumatobacter sp. TaxID=1967498 RepID=UPI003B52AD54